MKLRFSPSGYGRSLLLRAYPETQDELSPAWLAQWGQSVRWNLAGEGLDFQHDWRVQANRAGVYLGVAVEHTDTAIEALVKAGWTETMNERSNL